MIKHISMGVFKENAEGHSKKENMEKAKELSLNMREIHELSRIEIGFNFMDAPGACDFVSYSEYKDMDAVKAVISHPLHDKLVDFLKKVTEKTHSVTYKV